MTVRAETTTNGSQITQTKLHYLRKVDLFQDLSHEEMEEMDRTTTMVTCPAGRIFYMPGETGEVLFILKEGTVQLYRISPEGKKLVIATLGGGTIFGEMSIVGQGMHETFAEAIVPSRICVMSRTDVERLLIRRPRVSLRLLEIMSKRLADAEVRLESLAFRSLPARLASQILDLMEERGSVIEGFSHQDLSEMVGTYRETTTQILNTFKARGLIEIGRRRLTVLDREGLEEVSEG